ncbi:PspC domain-containing protein [Marisediminicola sp. LYQ134]|uniref:PspC domain-containing protein n=1 Tax=Marisediminicola sp. LYQ134 TaxID=3391061 RepID=UPI0039839131
MTTPHHRPPLARPRRVILGGVCEALSMHLGFSVRAVRVAMIVLTVAGGGGALLYLWLWALVPLEPAHATPDSDVDDTAVTRRAPVAALLVAVAAVASLVAFESFAAAEGRASLALLVVTGAAGTAVGWSLYFDRHDPGRSPRYGTIVRIASAGLLFVAGAVALASRPNAVNAVLGVGLVVLAVAVIAAPRVVTLWTELMLERSARVREEQRAEIAAHLHDSVLQTLALIQNRAGASSEVARIARAQERELRDWLFAAEEPAAGDLATELRRVAASVELDFPVRIDVVSAGASDEPASAPLLAAAREAMLNAARHAGGDVSVYLETLPGSTDVFVRDRGPGVDLDALPADRLGIRESIIGRMSRAGGSATVRPGAGGAGTEVHLRLEAPRD